MAWVFLAGAVLPLADPAGWSIRFGGLEWKPIEIGWGLGLVYAALTWMRDPARGRSVCRDAAAVLWGLSLLVLAAVNLPSAAYPGAALRMILRWTATWALFGGLRALRPGPVVGSRFLDGFVVGAGITLLLGIAESVGEDRLDPYLAWFRTAPTEVEGFRRWTSVFAHANVAGVWWALAALACGFRLHRTRSRWVYGVLSTAFTVGVLQTYSRGAALVLLTGWVLLTAWEWRWGLPKYGPAGVVTAVGLGLVFSYIDPVFRERWRPSGRPWVAARWEPVEFPTHSQATRQRVVLTNVGAFRWPHAGRHPVRLAYHLMDAGGRLYCLDVGRYPLGRDVAPGERAVLEVVVPPTACAPRCRGKWDLVWEHVRWFDPAVQQVMFGIRATGSRLPTRGPRLDVPPECLTGVYLPPPSVGTLQQAGRILQRQETEFSRRRLYALAWDMVRQRPWTGWGMDAFRHRLAEAAGGVWPAGTITTNQLLLEVLVGGGIVGCGLLMLWAIPMALRIGRRLWERDEGVVYRWMALLIGSTGLWDFMMGFYVVLGLFAVSAALGTEGERPQGEFAQDALSAPPASRSVG